MKAKTQVERDPMHPARLIFTEEAGILMIITARTAVLLACNVQSIIPSDFVTSVRNYERYFRVIRALQFSNHKPHILGLVILDILPGQVVYTRFSSLGRTRPIHRVRMLENEALTALACHRTFFQCPKASKKIRHKVPQRLSSGHY